MQANQVNCPHTTLLFDVVVSRPGLVSGLSSALLSSAAHLLLLLLWSLPGCSSSSSHGSGSARSHSITISSVTLKISLEAREKSPDD